MFRDNIASSFKVLEPHDFYIIINGQNFMKMYMEFQVLFSAHHLIMLYISSDDA